MSLSILLLIVLLGIIYFLLGFWAGYEKGKTAGVVEQIKLCKWHDK